MQEKQHYKQQSYKHNHLPLKTQRGENQKPMNIFITINPLVTTHLQDNLQWSLLNPHKDFLTGITMGQYHGLQVIGK